MEVTIKTQAGKDTGRSINLPAESFEITPNDNAIYLDVRQHLANKRQGTHKTKERADVKGSTKKIKKQKGTGTARFGDIKNPLFRGGGTVFGPRQRDYSFKLNKKLKKLARNSALTYKGADNQVVVLESLSFEEPKTKLFRSFLKDLELDNKKSLIVLPENDSNVLLSGRNLKKVKVTTVDGLNTYDILNADEVVFVEGSIDKLN
ncbi:MAG: 50S ribosomal protein L4 [Bacteroidota bacterium]